MASTLRQGPFQESRLAPARLDSGRHTAPSGSPASQATAPAPSCTAPRPSPRAQTCVRLSTGPPLCFSCRGATRQRCRWLAIGKPYALANMTSDGSDIVRNRALRQGYIRCRFDTRPPGYLRKVVRRACGRRLTPSQAPTGSAASRGHRACSARHDGSRWVLMVCRAAPQRAQRKPRLLQIGRCKPRVDLESSFKYLRYPNDYIA